jgi:hypothetical protein
MVWDDSAELPRLAAAGAVRCMRRKVVMNGADPCVRAVSTDDARVRQDEVLGLSDGLDTIARKTVHYNLCYS